MSLNSLFQLTTQGYALRFLRLRWSAANCVGWPNKLLDQDKTKHDCINTSTQKVA